MRGFYFITDAGLSRAGIGSEVTSALAAGVRVVQYREKEAPPERMRAEARELRRICRNVLFLTNDRVDLALEVGADGGCAISAVVTQPDVRAEIEKYQDLFKDEAANQGRGGNP